MTLGTWLALAIALVLAGEIVRALRHRALRGGGRGGSDRWRRFFKHRTATWGVGILSVVS